MNLMDKFADPQLIQTLSLSEKLAGAGMTALMGMGVTFTVLVLLWFFIAIMSKIMESVSVKRRTNEVPAEKVSPNDKNQDDGDMDPQLAAVISAAVTAFEDSDRVTNGYRQLSACRIKRISSDLPLWINMGRGE